MALDAQRHRRVAPFGRREKYHTAKTGSDLLREATLSTAHSAKHESHPTRMRFLHSVVFNLGLWELGKSGPRRRWMSLLMWNVWLSRVNPDECNNENFIHGC